jgi:cytochrome c5
MKRILIAITTMMVIVLSGIAYTQDIASKPSSSEGTIQSITLPYIRIELKEGEGRVKTETYCNICHSVDYIIMQPKANRAQWTASVNKMIKTFGAPVLPEDAEIVITYITQNYGTGK